LDTIGLAVTDYNRLAVQEILETSPGIAAVVNIQPTDTLTEAKAKIQNSEVTSQATVLNADIEEKISKCEELPRTMTSQVNTIRGTRDESIAVEQLGHTLKRKIKMDASMYYGHVPLTIAGPYRLRVGGKVDGIVDEQTLAEVKNRQNRLFRKVPEYELIQVQVYMEITNRQVCEFLERFGGSSWNTTIARDSAYYQDVIVAGLNEFVEQLEAIASSTTRQHHYYSLL
jgi:hypothetical protein